METCSAKIKVLFKVLPMVKKIEKYLCRSSFLVWFECHSSNFVLFRRTLFNGYSENIKIYNSLLHLSTLYCFSVFVLFFCFFIDIEVIKSHEIQVV